MLYGADFLQDLQVSMELHRLQVERELRTNWMRLRQSVLMAPGAEGARRHHAGVRVRVLRAVPPRCDCPGPSHACHQARSGERDCLAYWRESPRVPFRAGSARRKKLKEKDLAADSTLEMYLEFVDVVTKQACAKIT